MLIYFFPPLRAGTKYSVAVFGMFDGGQSIPLAGEEKTTLSDAPEPTLPDSYGKNTFRTSVGFTETCYFV